MQKLLTLLCAILMTLGAAGERDFTERVTASPEGSVHIANVAGEIRVQGWDEDQVDIKAELERDVERIDVTRDKSGLRIEVIIPRRHNHKKIRAWLTVKVPAMSALEVRGVSADIDVHGVYGPLELATVSGEVKQSGDVPSLKITTTSGEIEAEANTASLSLSSTSGDLNFEGSAQDARLSNVSGDIVLQGSFGEIRGKTISGDVDVAGTVAELDAETVSGEIDVAQVTGELEVTSVSGDLEAKGTTPVKLSAETVSGDITYRGGLAEKATLSMKSMSGEITLELPPAVDARFDVSTFSGDIENKLDPSATPQKRRGPGKTLAFTRGAGTARVGLESFSGEVVLSPLRTKTKP